MHERLSDLPGRAEAREVLEDELSNAKAAERRYKRVADFSLEPTQQAQAQAAADEASRRAGGLEDQLRGVHMRTGGLSEDEYLDLARLEEFAFRLEGKEAAVVLSAIDSSPGRFAGRERGTIVVNIDGEGAYEYVFMRARSGEILFLEKTWVSE